MRAQVARVLSLDKDARGFVALGQRDPVLAQLLAAAPGLRPPLFYSPYEAAMWAVLSARRPRGASPPAGDASSRSRWGQASTSLGERGGVCRCCSGCWRSARAAFTPTSVVSSCYARSAYWPWRRRPRRANSHATTLAGMDTESPRGPRCCTLPGIGPFYARSDLDPRDGHHCDRLLSVNEPRLLALLGELYGSGEPATPARAAQLAAKWTPWRTWAAVLVRAAGSRVLEDSAA